MGQILSLLLAKWLKNGPCIGIGDGCSWPSLKVLNFFHFFLVRKVEKWTKKTAKNFVPTSWLHKILSRGLSLGATFRRSTSTIPTLKMSTSTMPTLKMSTFTFPTLKISASKSPTVEMSTFNFSSSLINFHQNVNFQIAK
jgi:hypothetical protein